MQELVKTPRAEERRRRILAWLTRLILLGLILHGAFLS
jgi:hypothetical protein